MFQKLNRYGLSLAFRRFMIKQQKLLKNIYKKYPSAKDNFFLMLDNPEKEVLFHSDIFYKIERKDLSFKPVLSAKDGRVEFKLRQELKLMNFDESIDRFVIYKLDKPIGIISFTKDEVPSINELELLKEFKKEKEAIVNFINNQIYSLIKQRDYSKQ